MTTFFPCQFVSRLRAIVVLTRTLFDGNMVAQSWTCNFGAGVGMVISYQEIQLSLRIV